MTKWIAVAFGGGTNSTAMLCGFLERGIRPDLIAFADTGAEMPHTYEHVEIMKAKTLEWWGVELQVVRALRAGVFEGLEGQSIRTRMMPSLAYGQRSCSMKFKHEPQERLVKRTMRALKVSMATKVIGYGADERYRAAGKPLSKRFNRLLGETYWYPLIEWGWGRDECVAAIARHGLPQPGKSACFFCPASKKSEVFRLRDEYPDLLERALTIERLAQSTNRTRHLGLGGERNLWADWLKQDAAQLKMSFDIEPQHIPCGCYDGEAA